MKKIMLAGLAVGAVALNAPVAQATHQPQAVGCRFNGVSQATVTGQDTWQAAVQGWVVGEQGETVTVRCVIRDVASNAIRGAYPAIGDPAASGTTVAATAGPVTYTKSATETVKLCAQWSNSHGSGESCVGTTTVQIPPQAVIDAIIFILDAITQVEKDYIDPNVCPTLSAHNGVYGPVEIKEGTADPVTGAKGGDVYIAGEFFWDCPGYEPPPPPA